MNRSRIINLFATLLALTVFASLNHGCKSKDELLSLSKCEFRLMDVSEVKLAGVTVDEIGDVSELSSAELGILLLAILSESLPLSLKVNLEVRNPNKEVAALDKADWILYIDDQYITEGTYEERIEIPPNNGIAIMKVPVDADIAELVKGESNEALINLALNLANAGSEPSNITLKIKPYIKVRTKLLAYPGFFDVKTSFTSGE